MNRQEWNKLNYVQKYMVLEQNNMRYYMFAIAQSSWGKLTEHVQNLLSQIDITPYRRLDA